MNPLRAREMGLQYSPAEAVRGRPLASDAALRKRSPYFRPQTGEGCRFTRPQECLCGNQARLAVLSACETATIGEELVDEVVNFPTGMLQAGAAACIGSLWSVSDVSTALLMRRSYELWRAGIGPSEALRCAQ